MYIYIYGYCLVFVCSIKSRLAHNQLSPFFWFDGNGVTLYSSTYVACLRPERGVWPQLVLELTAFHREGSPDFPMLKLWGFLTLPMCGCWLTTVETVIEGDHSASNYEKDLSKQDVGFGSVQTACSLYMRSKTRRLGPSAKLDLLSTRSMYTESREDEAASQKSPTSAQLSWRGL